MEKEVGSDTKGSLVHIDTYIYVPKCTCVPLASSDSVFTLYISFSKVNHEMKSTSLGVSVLRNDISILHYFHITQTYFLVINVVAECAIVSHDI